MAVAKHPHQSLKVLYTKILNTLGAMPQDAMYRKHTETIVKSRLALVLAEPNALKLEEKINGGQIEEVVLQAERELLLARKMNQWKPWEPLENEPPKNQWNWPL
ncbi:unnamed protein product [Owenia fusiformis]|uniref:NADH dehydrogenase [ubiquinone] 1 alpha subcomplex subunit 5 n=1 Tax=Owenia fusiformis TaxID=6347 RepID=A0A8S4NLK7_OWEFU|nr:unnamed protein product [Owenia fusiformis]